MSNKHLHIGFSIKNATEKDINTVLELLESREQLIDSKTEIFDKDSNLPYFGQYGKSNMWGCVSIDILLSSTKILPISKFIKLLKD